MRPRRKLLRLTVVALLALPLIAVMAIQPAQADAIPPTNWTPVSLSDMTDASMVMTDPSGGVTVGCPRSGFVNARSFSSAGAVTQTVTSPSPVMENASFCAGNGTVGKDGTVYLTVTSSTGTAHYIEAWKKKTKVWRYTVPCGAYAYPRAMTVGANGNVYMVITQGGGSCGSTQLIGLSPTAQSSTNKTPKVVLNKPRSPPVRS